jgi:hypothetical protein
VVQDVINQSLEETITISQRELYAIAPEVRKHIKEQVMTHQVPTGPNANISVLEDVQNTNNFIPISLLHQ